MYNQQLGQGLFEMIPGVTTAINTVKAKVGEFFGLPLRIQKAIERTMQLNKVAQEKKMNVEAAKLVGIKAALNTAQSTYNKTEGSLKKLLDGLKAAKIPGFGVLPLALGALALTVVAAVTGLIKYVSYQERVLNDIEKGVLGPDAFKRPLFGLGFTTPLLIGGAALLAFFFLRKK